MLFRSRHVRRLAQRREARLGLRHGVGLPDADAKVVPGGLAGDGVSVRRSGRQHVADQMIQEKAALGFRRVLGEAPGPRALADRIPGPHGPL